MKNITVDSAIAQRHHIFKDDFTLTPIKSRTELSPHRTFNEAVNNKTNKKYYLLKAETTFTTDEQKYLFIRHAERATELAHPVLIPLLGFSDTAADLYYEYYPGLYQLSDEQLLCLDNTSIEIIILGMISGVSYLLSKGYSILELTLDTIFYSQASGPKFINYINFRALEMDYTINQFVEKWDERLIVYQIGQIMRELYNRKRKQKGEDSLQIPDGLDPTLIQCISSCNSMDNRPSIKDLFNSLSSLFKNNPDIQKYLEKLDSADKFRFNYQMDQEGYVPFQILKDENGSFYSNIFFDNNVNILHSCYIQEDVFSHKEYFPLLNRLPDSDIKLLLQNQKNPPKLFYEFLCYEREYLLLPDEDHNIFYSEKPETNYLIYQKLMEKSKTEENPNKAIYPIALKHLKIAAKKNFKDAKVKLALHYLKGDIVPANFDKCLMWFKSVAFGNKEDISHYINPINEKIAELNKEIANLNPEQKKAIKKAEDGELLYMIYVAFAFYSGIDHFPISPSKAVQYYRLAAKQNPHFMCLLGGMYLQGYIFPRNINRARHCFQSASLNGSVKAKIIDSMIRKHVWRYYLSDVSIENIYNAYMQCPESLSFDDTLIFPEINFLIQNMQTNLIHSSPYMSTFYFYDRRNEYGGEKKSEMKLAINTIDFKVPTLSDYGINNEDIKINQFYTLVHLINKMLRSNILPQQMTPVFHEERKSFFVNLAKSLFDNTIGFVFGMEEVKETEDSDITKQNMVKFNISPDMESNLISAIQNKYIPVEIKDGEYQFSTLSYVPQLSLPMLDARLRELKKVVDDSFEIVMKRILEWDKDKYLPKHINVPSKSLEDYIENQENVLRTTIKDHMPGNQFCQMFIQNMDDFEVHYSEQIIYTKKTENVNPEDVKTLLFLAESFFNGENGFPVNYTEAAKYYQMAADRGFADAQWKYAQLLINGLGTKQDGRGAYLYMKRSAEQQDPDGMLRYGLFIRHFLINHEKKESIELSSFQRYLEKSAETGNLNAINQLAMILESNYSYEQGTEKAVLKYEEVVSKGLLDSIPRIIHIYDNPENVKKYCELVQLAIGTCDHDISMRMIRINNHRKRFEQSEKLIKVGLCFDRDAFLPNYAKHIVLYSGGDSGNMKERIAYAKSLLTPTLTCPSDSVLKNGYLETYLMAMLTILNKANEYEEACQLFIKNMNCLTTKSKKEFIDFYMHINKKVARQYQLSINSYLPEYRACVEAFLLIKQKGAYVKTGYDKLKVILQENSSNQFALLKRGKVLLKNHLFMRRNISKALDFIQKAAKQNCPEARFEYGKELYYGQTIPMDRWKAFKYFKKAFDITNQDPRAGYFLSKKCYVKRNLIKKSEAEDSLKVACRSGYRRALFKLGKRFYYSKGNKSVLGIILIKKARDQEYFKAIDFLNKYESGELEDPNQENEQKAYFAFAKELYYGRIIAQDTQMSFILFLKFMKSKEPDYRAGYFLSKKKYIEMELITPAQARNALVISAKAKYKRSQFRLGKLYYMNEGKKEKGLNLIRKAKKQNYKKAIDFLKKINLQELKMSLSNAEEGSAVYIPKKKLDAEFNSFQNDRKKFLMNFEEKSFLLSSATDDDDEPDNEKLDYLAKKEDTNNNNSNNTNNNNTNNNNNKNSSNNSDNNDSNTSTNNNNINSNNMGKIKNDVDVPLKEIKIHDDLMKHNRQNKNIPFQKSITSSTFKLPIFSLPLKLSFSSSKMSKSSEFYEPLLSEFTKEEEDDDIHEDNTNEKRKIINLNDEVSSDFSDEPFDENEK